MSFLEYGVETEASLLVCGVETHACSRCITDFSSEGGFPMFSSRSWLVTMACDERAVEHDGPCEFGPTPCISARGVMVEQPRPGGDVAQ